MPTNCECPEVEVENCPPYLSVETFNNYATEICSNCSATDTESVSAEDYVDTYGLDRCCPILTIYKDNQIIYSFDGGVNWVETGVAFSRATISYGALTFTTGVLLTPNITDANTTFERNDRNMVAISSNNLMIVEQGNYFITVDFSFGYAAASNTVMHIELYQNNVAATPYRQAHSMTFNNTSAPTEYGSSEFMRLSFLRRFSGGSLIKFMFINQGTTFGGGATAYVNIVKLSN